MKLSYSNFQKANKRGLLPCRHLCRLIGLVGVSIFLSGCLSFGKNFNSDISWIKKEQTNQKDVKLVLGSPQEVGSASGVPTWTYYFYRYKMVGSDSRKELKFYWKEDATVRNYSFSSSFHKDVEKSAN